MGRLSRRVFLSDTLLAAAAGSSGKLLAADAANREASRNDAAKTAAVAGVGAPKVKKKIKVAVTAARTKYNIGQGYLYARDYDRQVDDRQTEENLQYLLDLYAEAGRQKADLVTSYENITNVQSLPELMDRVETVPGPTTERFAKVAKRFGMFAQINLYENDAGRVFNTSVLIDRDGKIVGKYRKVYLPPQERWHVSPGDGFPVCETEIGAIGFSICYDIMFPEAARAAALNGADIIIHSGNSSYTCREMYTRVRAAENMLWLLVCNILSMRMSEIVDPYGTPIAHSGTEGELITAEIDPRMERDMPRDNHWSGVRSLRGRLMQERVPSASRVLADPHPPILRRYQDDRIPSTPQEYERAYAEGSRYLGVEVGGGAAKAKKPAEK